MEATPILHYSGDYTTKPGHYDTRLLHYPFGQLPIVESHIYPHYVIFNLGEKLMHFFGENLDQEPIPGLSFESFKDELNTVYAAHLVTCYNLYKRWIGAVPPTWFTRDSDGEDQGQSDAPDDAVRSEFGSRMTRSRSKSQAGGTDGGRNGTSAPVDSAPTATENDAFSVDSAENIVYPTDSISCGDRPFNGDEERNESVGSSDTDSDFSDALWVDEIQTWRTNVVIAVEKEERKKENDEGDESMEVVKRASSEPGLSVGSYSESSTVIGETVFIGLTLGKPRGTDGKRDEWEGTDAVDVDVSSKFCQDGVGLPGSLSMVPKYVS